MTVKENISNGIIPRTDVGKTGDGRVPSLWDQLLANKLNIEQTQAERMELTNRVRVLETLLREAQNGMGNTVTAGKRLEDERDALYQQMEKHAAHVMHMIHEDVPMMREADPTAMALAEVLDRFTSLRPDYLEISKIVPACIDDVASDPYRPIRILHEDREYKLIPIIGKSVHAYLLYVPDPELPADAPPSPESWVHLLPAPKEGVMVTLGNDGISYTPFAMMPPENGVQAQFQMIPGILTDIRARLDRFPDAVREGTISFG